MNRANRRAFTITELLIGLVAGVVLMLGMGAVMLQLFRGFNESRDFSEATSRIDLIRTLSFDARTSRMILYPTAWDPSGVLATSKGDIPAAEGIDGDRIQFISLDYDTDTNTTTPYRVTWQSQRAAGDPFWTVVRWRVPVDASNQPIGTQERTFQQDRVGMFEVIRISSRAFRVDMRAVENDETAAIQMVVTCRNVIN